MKRRAPTDPAFRRRVTEGVCEVDVFDRRTIAAARADLPPAATLERAAEAFQALSHPGRLRILKALSGRELCVCDISEVLGASMSGTSQQLRELRRIGALQYRVAGKLAYYTVADPFWVRLADTVLEQIEPSAAVPRARRRTVPA